MNPREAADLSPIEQRSLQQATLTVAYCPSCHPIDEGSIVAVARTIGPPCPECGKGATSVVIVKVGTPVVQVPPTLKRPSDTWPTTDLAPPPTSGCMHEWHTAGFDPMGILRLYCRHCGETRKA